MAHGILVLSAAVTGIPLDGIDNAVFTFLHDTYMVSLSILGAGAATIIPVKENDHTRNRFRRAIQPLSSIFEPLNATNTACKLRDNTAVDVAALVGAPTHKAGTPLYTPPNPYHDQ